MIIDTEILISVNGRNAIHYEKLGYEIPRWKDTKGDIRVPKGTQILVKVEDLYPMCNAKISVRCDYCGKEYKMQYSNYANSVINGIIKKVACKGRCSQEKLEESNLKQYGVRVPCQREEIDIKMKNTMIERYGVEYAAQNKEINQRAIKKKILNIVEVYNRF